jgi:hypothetical protein
MSRPRASTRCRAPTLGPCGCGSASCSWSRFSAGSAGACWCGTCRRRWMASSAWTPSTRRSEGAGRRSSTRTRARSSRPRSSPTASRRPEQGRDLAEQDAELLVERHGECDRVPPQLDGRRAGGVRGLLRTTALHPTVALLAAADVDAEAAHHRTNGRQIFLVLIGDARLVHDAPAVRTPGRKRRVVDFVEARRGGSPPVPSACGTRLAARALRMRCGSALRERRRLSGACAPRRFRSCFSRAFSRCNRSRSRCGSARSRSTRAMWSRKRALSRRVRASLSRSASSAGVGRLGTIWHPPSCKYEVLDLASRPR